MSKTFFKNILFTLFIVLSANLYGSDSITKDFMELEAQTPIHSLFPKQFSAEQIQAFCTNKQILTSAGTFAVGDDFHATKPYSFQVFTGTYNSFASRISFTETVETEENCLWGTYSFKSTYTTYNDATFKVKLSGNSFKTFNLSASVLGDRDFIATPTQPVKSTSFYYIKNTDEKWIRQTNCEHRLNGNCKEWLLILTQLQGKDIYSLREDDRENMAHRLFQEYLNKKGYTLNNNGILSMDQYVEINNDLRTQILACHGIQQKDIPDVSSQEDKIKLFDGKKFFAVLTQNQTKEEIQE